MLFVYAFEYFAQIWFWLLKQIKRYKNAIIVITITVMILQMISVILLSFHFVFYGLSSDIFFIIIIMNGPNFYTDTVYHSALNEW